MKFDEFEANEQQNPAFRSSQPSNSHPLPHPHPHAGPTPRAPAQPNPREEHLLLPHTPTPVSEPAPGWPSPMSFDAHSQLYSSPGYLGTPSSPFWSPPPRFAYPIDPNHPSNSNRGISFSTPPSSLASVRISSSCARNFKKGDLSTSPSPTRGTSSTRTGPAFGSVPGIDPLRNTNANSRARGRSGGSGGGLEEYFKWCENGMCGTGTESGVEKKRKIERDVEGSEMDLHMGMGMGMGMVNGLFGNYNTLISNTTSAAAAAASGTTAAPPSPHAWSFTSGETDNFDISFNGGSTSTHQQNYSPYIPTRSVDPRGQITRKEKDDARAFWEERLGNMVKGGQREGDPTTRSDIDTSSHLFAQLNAALPSPTLFTPNSYRSIYHTMDDVKSASGFLRVDVGLQDAALEARAQQYNDNKHAIESVLHQQPACSSTCNDCKTENSICDEHLSIMWKTSLNTDLQMNLIAQWELKRDLVRLESLGQSLHEALGMIRQCPNFSVRQSKRKFTGMPPRRNGEANRSTLMDRTLWPRTPVQRVGSAYGSRACASGVAGSSVASARSSSSQSFVPDTASPCPPGRPSLSPSKRRPLQSLRRELKSRFRRQSSSSPLDMPSGDSEVYSYITPVAPRIPPIIYDTQFPRLRLASIEEEEEQNRTAAHDIVRRLGSAAPMVAEAAGDQLGRTEDGSEQVQYSELGVPCPLQDVTMGESLAAEECGEQLQGGEFEIPFRPRNGQ
ncbi:hypothetical protein GMOD_00010302 [Pyrenophora seminiperda CCB06]|uniref:Uncharacterized protein n=1 Tax=Pyrenophora seminiperda CCB06 TaxID=1302712 RepID=A0A3M7M5F0_9PLEO|nr:hypothetical protein GMOD_00010302 [Pyrenophora seminiperda CCB06]